MRCLMPSPACIRPKAAALDGAANGSSPQSSRYLKETVKSQGMAVPREGSEGDSEKPREGSEGDSGKPRYGRENAVQGQGKAVSYRMTPIDHRSDFSVYEAEITSGAMYW